MDPPTRALWYLARSEDVAPATPDGRRLRELELDRETWLHYLSSRSSKRHALVSDPAAAEIIFVPTINASTHPLIARYPDRCVAIDESDAPDGNLHGIYASYTRRMAFSWAGRFRTGSYQLYPRVFTNPAVQASAGTSWREPKAWLASYVGRNSHPCRERLMAQRFTRRDILLRDSSGFDLFHGHADKRRHQETFAAIMADSKFVLCPRGDGASSIRLFEAMQMGVAPVIISDAWVLPQGPDWRQCAVMVPEHLRDLEQCLVAHEPYYQDMGRAARAAYDRFFAEDTYFDYLVDQAAEIRARQRIPERWLWRMRGMIAARSRLRARRWRWATFIGAH